MVRGLEKPSWYKPIPAGPPPDWNPWLWSEEECQRALAAVRLEAIEQYLQDKAVLIASSPIHVMRPPPWEPIFDDYARRSGVDSCMYVAATYDLLPWYHRKIAEAFQSMRPLPSLGYQIAEGVAAILRESPIAYPPVVAEILRESPSANPPLGTISDLAGGGARGAGVAAGGVAPGAPQEAPVRSPIQVFDAEKERILNSLCGTWTDGRRSTYVVTRMATDWCLQVRTTRPWGEVITSPGIINLDRASPVQRYWVSWGRGRPAQRYWLTESTPGYCVWRRLRSRCYTWTRLVQ